jgi:hypothetical protein
MMLMMMLMTCSYLRGLFLDMFERHNYVNDSRYDWVVAAELRAANTSNTNSSSNSNSKARVHSPRRRWRY